MTSRRRSPRSLLLTCALAGAALLLPREAAAFCGFYVAGADAKLFNDATVVVLMRDGTRTVLSMQNNYQGPPEDFALVIPVPVVLQEGDVKILRNELFERVERLAAPRLVEYWEADPCVGSDVTYGGRGGGGTGAGYGVGSGAGFGGRGTVTIEAEFEVGEYQIVILSATESSGLDQWLRDNDYNIPAGAEPLLGPYIQQGMKFFVAKVNPAKVTFASNGRATLSPLRFHYDSEQFVLPVRLGLLNAPEPGGGGKQDLLIHILAPSHRYEVANYPNVTIPTNLDLQESAKEQFGEFYVALFDHTLAQHPGAVVTEYAWGSGKCDPCPSSDAALTNKELLELGGDVLDSADGLSAIQFNPSGVRQGTPTVEGNLDKDIIRRIVRAHINEIRTCQNRGKGGGGKVVVQFTIAETGKVASAVVAETTLADPNVPKCIAKAVEKWLFPKPKNGVVTVSYPFTLDPGGPGAAVWPSSFVLTRLHARYDASSLGEDLVFEMALPIWGGREVLGDDGELERGATILPYGLDNFQARYAIRHAWTGEINCEEPVRGIWVGPPVEQPLTVARQLTELPRGASLGSFVSAGAGEQIGLGAVAIAEPAAGAEPAIAAAPSAGQPQKGCTCSSASQPPLPAALLTLLALLGLRRRRAPSLRKPSLR